MMKVLILGKSGQLASCLQTASIVYPELQCTFLGKEELSLLSEKEVILASLEPYQTYDCIINCMAYTAVDQAEQEEEIAFKINAVAAGILAEFAHQAQIPFLHISTDFVFNGESNCAYSETDNCSPLGVYGKSKFAGEQAIQQVNPKAIIIRTSWLYSPYGKNFCLSMLHYGRTRDELRVVNDQIGIPTSALDLAHILLGKLEFWTSTSGIYHFSNTGTASWFEFAAAILEYSGLNTAILPIKTAEYPTPAKRPAFSVLDTTKLSNALSITIPHWRKSLQHILSHIANE